MWLHLVTALVVSISQCASEPCHGASCDEFALVLVNSARSNFGRRSAIRDTWGSSSARVLFLLANISCSAPPASPLDHECVARQQSPTARREHLEQVSREAALLRKELDAHQDLVLVNVIESYTTLAQKIHAGFSWTIDHSRALWVLKVDDDVILSVPRLLHQLRMLPAMNTVVGTINRGGRVHRSGRWKELRYRPNVYPPYPMGPGYALSMDLVRLVAATPRAAYSYASEDASLGILFSELQLKVKFKHREWWRHLWSGSLALFAGDAAYILGFVGGVNPALGTLTSIASRASGISVESQRFFWGLFECYQRDLHLLSKDSGCVDLVERLRLLSDQCGNNCTNWWGRVPCPAKCRPQLRLDASNNLTNKLIQSMMSHPAGSPTPNASSSGCSSGLGNRCKVGAGLINN